MVAKSLKRGDYIVFESTVYPGCTEEICIPILENISGLKLNTDFKIGYSPERINPGDKNNTLTSITKVVSGSDQIALENISSVYESIIEAGVHKTPSIKVAEASKIIENTQRDVNIALMNEFSMICSKLDIDTNDVLEAAGTKWNFLKFYPGLVGGHCIGVDPYYLTYKSRDLNINAQVISNSRFRNDSMPFYIAQSINNKLVEIGLNPKSSRVLVKGITYKENVTDIRNSKVAELVQKLSLFGMESWVEDPHADPDEVLNVYGIECKKEHTGTFDVVILAVSHSEYEDLTNEYFDAISHEETIFFDLKGSYKNQLLNRRYMSL
jgi:UDP-N-acetyl-D-galactosamine dehydrogenase